MNTESQMVPADPSTPPMVATEVKIDMTKILSVGVAKMERKIGQAVKELQREAAELDKRIAAKHKESESLLKNLVPAKMLEIGKQIRAWGLSGVQAEIDIQVVTPSPSANRATSSGYTLAQLFLKAKDAGRTTLFREQIDLTEEQLAIKEVISALNNTKSALTSKIIGLKGKLADVPKLERQMQARLVEQQLRKSEDGGQILDNLMDELDADIDFLGDL